MKKIFTYILALITLLLSAQYAFAQVNTGVSTTLTTETGCAWSAGPGSDLTVYDNDLCIITGTASATSVGVQYNADGLGQAGGKLIVGGTNTNTTFTVSGSFTADGIVEIGAAGNPAYNSQLVVGTDLYVAWTGSNGDVDIIANTNVTNGSNSIDVNGALYLYGNGTLTNNDNAQSTIDLGTIRGTLENLNPTGTIKFDNPYSNTIYFEESGSLNNDGIINSDSPLEISGAFSGDNSGEITVNNNSFTIANSSTATFTNSGEINITGPGMFAGQGALLVGFSTIFNNTGTITTTDFMAAYGGTFNNNSGGSVETVPSLPDSPGRFLVFGYMAWGGHAIFNNNSGASVTANETWLVSMDPSTGPGYTDAPTINNNSGATSFVTDSMTFSFEDGGVTYFGDQTYGGIFNNSAPLTVNGTGSSVEIYVGGKLNNLSGGVIDITLGNIKMGTTDDDVNPKGDCESGTALMCVITNASIASGGGGTFNGFRLNSSTAVINMYDYSKIDNTGGIMNVCGTTSCTSSSVVAINTNNTDIVNGTGGTLNLNGDLTLGYDHFLDSDGAVNIKSYTASNFILNTSADFYSKGATTLSGTYQNATLNNAAQLRIGSSGSFISNPSTKANSVLTLNNTSSITNAGTISFTATAALKNSSSITNNDSGNPATFTIDDAGATVNTLTLNDSATTTDNATFTNAAGATTTIGTGTTSSADGRINIYNAGQFSNTGGTVSAATLYIGSQGAARNGGTYTNSGTTGSTTLRYASTTAGNYGIYIYQGHLENSNATTSPSFICNAMIYLNGSDATTENKGRLTNSGIFEQKSTALDILSYSELNLTGGRLVQTNVSAGTLTSSATTSSVNISAGASLSYPTITITNGLLANSGTIQRLNIAGTPQAQPITLTVSNSSTFNNNSGAYFRLYSGTATFNNTSTFSNAGNINYVNPTGERQGNIYIDTSTAVTNTGTIFAGTLRVRYTTFTNNLTVNTNYVNVGDVASPTAIFNNNSSLTVITNLNIGNATNNGTVFNNDGTVTAGTTYIYSPGVYTNYITRTSTITNVYVYGGALFTNNGTLTGTGGFNLGTETITGGNFNNNGTVNYTGSGFSRVYTPGTFTNAAGKSSATPYLEVYKNGKFENYGTCTGSTFYLGIDPAGIYRRGGVYNNYSTGVFNFSGTAYILASDDPATNGIFNNYNGATFTAGSLSIGTDTYDGGKFNNFSAPSSAPYTTYGVVSNARMYIRRGGIFNNEQNATLRAHSLQVGLNYGALSYFNQKAGSAPPAQYTEMYALSRFTTDHMYIMATGRFVSQNFINQRAGQIQLNSTGGQFLGQDGTGTNSYTRLDSASGSCSLYVQAGSMTIDPNSTLALSTDCITYINTTGTVTVNGTGYIDALFNVTGGGKFYSGNDSTLRFKSTGSSINMDGSSPFIELAGDVITDVLYANNSNGGEICIGDYVGTFPSGTCTRNASGSLTIDENWHTTPNVPDTAIGLFVKNTTAGTTTKINIANDVISWAGVGAENGPTGAQSIINVMDGATVTVHGRYLCNNSEYCALAVGTYNSGAGSAIVNVYGTYNVASDSTGKVMLGQTSGGRNTLNIKSDVSLGHGLLTTTTTSQPFIVYATGKLNIERTDASNYGYMNNAASCTISGLGESTNGNRGANVNGKLSCYSALTVNSTGSMDVGRMTNDTDRGEVYVNGSTTTISGFTELDGLLDTGSDNGDTLTVTSTGRISSGVGTATNFEILAHDLTVNSGTYPNGSISSDGVSTIDRTGSGTGGGSFAGEGVDSASSPVATYGTTKATAPDYGMSGENTGALTANGGGGVRITATGDVTINGIISADGANGTSGNGSGSGGTVIFTHSPTETGAFFTGSGTIRANGGGVAGTYPGGGGRIVIDSKLLEEPDFGSYDFGETTAGVIQTNGGTNGSGLYAAAGTIVYLGDSHNADDTLVIDQNGNSPDSNSQTDIFDTPTFSRVEVRESADVDLSGLIIATPGICYNISSTVTGTTTCNSTTTAKPDKPDTLYINNSVTGAGSGTEPGKKSGKTGVDAGVSPTALSVGDLTPAFSAIYRSSASPAKAAANINIQVDDSSDFGSTLWNYSGAITDRTGGTLDNGERSADVEYAGTTLSTATTYYVRVAFTDTNGTGLWSHADYNSQYKFIIANYFDIDAACTGDAFSIKDAVNSYPNNNIQNTSTRRFGKGSCTMNFTSGTASWQIKFGMANGETGFNDGGSNNIDAIPYTTDCDMDETGMTAEEKFGFYISNLASGGGTIQNDTEQCVSTTYSFSSTTGKYHDVETYASADKIIAGTVQATAKSFDLNLFANVSAATVVTNYTIDLMNIITTDP